MKTDLTVQIELALMKKYFFDEKPYGKKNSGKGRRFAFECKVYSENLVKIGAHKIGRVDFVTLHKKRDEEFISCFEIKISKSDFKSKSGHNFIGDYNYYVIPSDLVEYVKDNKEKHIGILEFKDGKLKTVCNATRVKDRYLKSSNDMSIKHNMLTACNSTIRRLLLK